MKDEQKSTTPWLENVCASSLYEPDARGILLNVAILLWPTFPLMSLAGLVESLRHAGDHGDQSQQRYARWEILGPPGSIAVSSCGIPVAATGDYLPPGEFDYVFVIGGLMKDIDQAPRRHREYIHKARGKGTPVVGVCTGSHVLAQEKLLDGRRACVHAYHQAEFEHTFPGIRTVLNKDFEITDGVATVLGGISILSLMSEIIGRHFGADRSAKVVHQMSLSGKNSVSPMDRAGLFRHLEIADPRIQKALVILDAQATDNPSVANLAKSLGLSERHFLRLFRQQVGTSPKDYLVDTKLRAAVWLLRNSTESITSIAYSTGFSSGANLADHCRKRMKASPSQIRQMR